MTYTQPLLLIFLAVTVAGLLAIGPCKGKHWALAGVLGLLLISWPPMDWLIARPLESGMPVRAFVAPPGLQAIVVLGSSSEPSQYERPYPVPDREMFRRCEHAAWIFTHRARLPVLACEGRQRNVDEHLMQDLLRRAGVVEGMIWMEERSRSTHENAVYGARILHDKGVKRVALVVDAQSMPRAAACFRKEGIEVTPAPIEQRTWGSFADELLPNWEAIRRNEITFHEVLGLAWYRLRGWI